MQARRLPSQKTFVRFVNFVVRESDCDAHRSLYNYRMKKSLFVSILCVSLALGFGLRAQTKNANSQEQSAKKDENAKPIDSSNMDTSVKPTDDFFLYANGGWIKRTEIPPEYSRWGSFNILIEHNNDALHAIAEKVAKTKADPKTAPEMQKVGDYYTSGMDEKTIEAMRTKPLQDEFGKIDNLKDRQDVLKEIAHLHLIGVSAFFSFGSSQDDKDSTREIAQAVQGGLGMPDRDYYTKDDDASKKLRDAYVAHVTKMLTLLGESAEKAGTDAKKIMALETSLAKASRTRVELRDPEKNYNKMTQAQLQTLTPDWNWGDYFKEIGLSVPGDIDVHQPDFFKAVNAAFTSTSIDDWKTYLRWHLINGAASALSSDFVNEDFNFKETTLRGTPKIKPRWKRVILSEDGEIGEALGKLYVAEYFPPEAKARALELINNLKEALADRIKTLEWMDEPTKKAALDKLAAFQVKIGYPEKWRDYSTLQIDRGPFVLNELRAENFEAKRELNKIGKPVDRTEWGMTPPTVNAYYNPKMNEIVFPAGILQPPFFYANADDAVNYGGIGAVIGHEMTHGFDDQGRQYDKVGNLTDWWSPKSAEEFKKRSGAIVAQYSEYEPLPGLHVNGELTQGENIADVGGVKLAYAALQKALDKHPKAREQKIDGFTPEQRFFLSFAAIWRQKIRDEEQKLRLNVDPHSPAHYRVNGPLSDLPEFQKAFNVPDSAPMVRAADKRVNIW
ncbi:MAG TPA: M13 family metallopeptidase [Chthoniobacterales bacterium]|nr:M13 family metallopeptidase [Chthoniobacterales bacterium]